MDEGVGSKTLVEELLNKARSLEREGRVEDAVALYSRVFSLDSGNEEAKKKIYELKSVEMIIKSPNMIEPCISPDNRYLALTYKNTLSNLIIIDLKNRKEIIRIEHPNSFFGIAWHPSGHYLTTRQGERLIVINVENKKIVFETEQQAPLSTITWHPSGRYLVALEDDRILRIWDFEGRRVTRELDLGDLFAKRTW
ncbi:MAG: WD40 repeat domain-containing protein, partial [Candidatus Njordarchaeia archaeon]